MEKDFIDYINIFLQIIANIAVVWGLVYAVKQFKIYKEETKINQERATTEKSIQIAKLFADKLLDDIFEVIKICKDKGIEEIMNTVKSAEIIDFDYKEFQRILKCDEVKKIVEIVNKLSEMEEEKISFTLNQMEFVCMELNTKIANEITIYQSLHQVCLRFIVDVYPFIALVNLNNCEKLYTNIIKLYNVWNTRSLDKKREETELVNQALVCTENAMNEIDNKVKSVIVESPTIK